jgi:hypothetical protein
MIQFTEKDAQTCFACSIGMPVFRMISLERVPSFMIYEELRP